jgi:toxin YoeB
VTRTIAFDPNGWEDYVYWQTQGRKTLKRVNQLIADAQRDPFAGVGKPEPLKHILSGAWSRRIDEANRLVYYVTDDHIAILQAATATDLAPAA